MSSVEKEIDERLEKLFSHPLFLQAMGTALNFNSFRKIWLNRALQAGWKALQLPNRRDQERTLHLINELHHRIAELEAKLQEANEIDEEAAPVLKKKTKRETLASAHPKTSGFEEE